MDDFIGTEFVTPKGSTLTVVGDNGLTSNKKKYIFTCSICSKDEELWPYGSIQIRKSDILRDKFNCGCGANTYYNKEQQIVRCKRSCKELNYQFIGLEGEYKSARETYVNAVNTETDNPIRCTIGNLVRGVVGDKLDADYRAKVRNKEKRLQRITNLNLTVYKGRGIIYPLHECHEVLYRCFSCEGDIYSQNNLCNGIFTTAFSQIVKGFLPCRCSGKPLLTLKQKELKLKLICESEGLVLLDVWKDYNIVMLKYKCKRGNLKTTYYDNFMCGRRCTCCAKYGFDSQKSGNFYLVRWRCGGHDYIKYGITNKNVLERINKQKSKTDGGEYEVIGVWNFKYGLYAEELEDLIDYYFRYEDGVEKKVMPDGFTETLLYNKSNVNFIINKANWYKKKKEP